MARLPVSPSAARPRPLAAALWLCALAAPLAAYCALRLELTTDITHFMPDGQDAEAARTMQRLSRSALGQRMVLTVSGADPQTLVRAGADLAARLARRPEILRVYGGIDPAAQERLYALYFPRRHHLFSVEPEREYAALLSDAGLLDAAERLRTELASVRAPLARASAPDDPLLAFARALDRLEAARATGLAPRDGTFVTRDGRYAVLLVQTRGGALDGSAQQRALERIAHDFGAVARAHGGRLTLEQSGVGRYAAHAESTIRGDVTRVSLWSSAALLLLFLVVFRSLRALLIVSLPVLAGMLAASAATLAVFGPLHGATLAFGATLIGVCVDYPVHLVVHHELGASERSGLATLRAIWPALLLASLTTLAGLAGFGWASLPGIREIAFFTSVGVLAALMTTRFALPHLLGSGGRARGLQRQLAAGLARAAAVVWNRPAASICTLVAAALLCAAGLPRLRFGDDLAAWVPAPRALRAEDERVRARVQSPDPGRLVLVDAPDTERALQANDRVAAALAQAQRAGELDGFQSLHAFLWSEALQQRNLRALGSASGLRARFEHAFDHAGFTKDAFAPFFSALARPAAALRLPEVLASPIAPAASSFVLDERGSALVTYLRGVRNPDAVARRISAIPEARYFDQPAFLRATYAAFRTRVLELIGLGALVVFALVAARYRALRPALAAVLPATLAAGGALAVLALLGLTIDLFHAIGLLLVLSMGEDYGVFLVESRDERSMAATLLALVLSCASTVLSFGLLSMSAIPALRSLGQVIGVGILLALLWAPAGLVLLGRGGGRR